MNRRKGFKFFLIFFTIILMIGALIFRNDIRHLINGASKGSPVDSLNGVYVYYNGAISNVEGRNLSPDNYNLGLKYQCVEFVKRYYYLHYRHKMPDSYGHAVSFYDASLKDSSYNRKRDLLQLSNPSKVKPQIGDILIYSGTEGNPYGHVSIISDTKVDEIEIIQQNPGIGAPSRVKFKLLNDNGLYKIDNPRILGRLSKR